MTGARDPSRATPASREERAVTSRDGTRIAFDRMGDGPAVILVGGATMVRQGNGALAVRRSVGARGRAIVASVPSAEHRRIPNQSHLVDPQALATVLAAFDKG
jgi:hypothetical protein